MQWSYDTAGRPLSRTLPDGQRESFAYDLQGQLLTHTGFGGQATRYTYDSQGRPLSRIVAATASAPARTTTWSYTADGRAGLVGVGHGGTGWIEGPARLGALP